jgi:hypothetical protein
MGAPVGNEVEDVPSSVAEGGLDAKLNWIGIRVISSFRAKEEAYQRLMHSESRLS